MGQLEGKVALVVGGARGLGAAQAELFSQEGATVVVADVLRERGEATAGGLKNAEFRFLDVTSEQNWNEVVDDIVARHGRLDVMIENAGIYQGRKLVNIALHEWHQVVAVNQTGPFLGLQTAGRAMIRCGNGGSIVVLGSVAGLWGPWGGTSYSASKWAIRGMCRVAAKEFGPHGIRVNSIHPGYIQTELLDSSTKHLDRDEIIKAIPLGRIGDACEVAALALFLASDQSSYCTGQEFVIDGGLHG
ncbi:MAG: SDR family NAD(P)-dependent oxidoreductase [Actinomycetota bacterium]